MSVASAAGAETTALILVVDDNVQNRILADALLSEAGYTVALAEDGEAALRAFESRPIDLVLLDVVMPGLDGFATCKRMRQLPAGPDLPIVFLTSLSDLGTHKQALDAGADDFLTKPIQRTELLLRVGSLLRIRRLSQAQQESYRLIREQRDRLAEVERQREATTALIVHDMKNPLAAILANADYLSTASNLDADQVECMQDIVGASRRMNRMVMNLLDISRSEDGGLQPRIQDVDVVHLCNDVRHELGKRLEEKQQGFVVTHRQQPVVLPGDPEMLSRLLMNLVENAMKYSPTSGVIELLSMRDEVDDSFRLCVRDQGQGVPLEHRERIFEKFVRLDNDAETARKSRGLGLASCRVAAEAHGGTIWVEDNYPRGAAFWVKLPARRA